MDNNRFKILNIRISTDQYHYIKFILEGYDGLGILSKGENDIVILRYPEEMQKDLMLLLSSIGKKIRRSMYIENELD